MATEVTASNLLELLAADDGSGAPSGAFMHGLLPDSTPMSATAAAAGAPPRAVRPSSGSGSGAGRPTPPGAAHPRAGSSDRSPYSDDDDGGGSEGRYGPPVYFEAADLMTLAAPPGDGGGIADPAAAARCVPGIPRCVSCRRGSCGVGCH